MENKKISNSANLCEKHFEIYLKGILHECAGLMGCIARNDCGNFYSHKHGEWENNFNQPTRAMQPIRTTLSCNIFSFYYVPFLKYINNNIIEGTNLF